MRPHDQSRARCDFPPSPAWPAPRPLAQRGPGDAHARRGEGCCAARPAPCVPAGGRRLVLIDFGLVARVQRKDQDLFVSSIIHLANKDYAALSN